LRGNISNSIGIKLDDKISRESRKLAENTRTYTFTAVVSATSRAASPAFAKRLIQPAHNPSVSSCNAVFFLKKKHDAVSVETKRKFGF